MNVSIFEDNIFEPTDRPFEKVYLREPWTAGRLKCQDESLHWMVGCSGKICLRTTSH